MARSLDRFDLMRLYVRIAETGSVSGAGRSLGLSQPSASRQLRELETLLGIQLIVRSTHELSFTDAGRQFLIDARRMLTDWETASEQLQRDRETLQGRIRIVAPVGLGQTVLADVLSSFVDANPAVSIDWLLKDAATDLTAEGIDLWIRVGSIPDEGLIVRGLWRIERVLVAAAESDIEATDPEELATQPAVSLYPYAGKSLELLGPQGAVKTIEPAIAISTDNLFAAERLVRDGRGYAVLPLWLVESAIDEKQLRVVCAGWHPPPLQLSVAYPHSRYRPKRVSAFLEHLKGEIPKTGAGILAL